VVSAKTPTRLGIDTGESADMFAARYSRTGVTPLPFMVAGLVAIVAAAWAIDWARLAPGATDPVRTSEWWINVTSVLAPGESPGLGAYSQTRMWTALALLVIAAIVLAIWIGRIGTNVRMGHAPFGAFLPLLAFPAWWMLPITIGITADGTRSRSDALIRYLVAFGILFAQFLLVRWPTLNRIWRAGRLPYDVASIVLWLPMLIPWSMIVLSNAYTLFVVGEDGRRSDSDWLPTANMVDWARWITRASGVAIVVLLVVVSVMQHIGLRQDRADDLAMRER